MFCTLQEMFVNVQDIFFGTLLDLRMFKLFLKEIKMVHFIVEACTLRL